MKDEQVYVAQHGCFHKQYKINKTIKGTARVILQQHIICNIIYSDAQWHYFSVLKFMYFIINEMCGLTEKGHNVIFLRSLLPPHCML